MQAGEFGRAKMQTTPSGFGIGGWLRDDGEPVGRIRRALERGTGRLDIAAVHGPGPLEKLEASVGQGSR